MKALKWLWAYLRHYKASMFFALFTVVIVVFAFIQPVVVGRLVDEVIMPASGGKTKTDLLFFYVFFLIGLVVLKEIFGYLIKEYSKDSLRKNKAKELYALYLYYPSILYELPEKNQIHH